MPIYKEWVKEITREQYERSIIYGHHIPAEDKGDIFTEAELYGYGVYSTCTYATMSEDGKVKYFVRYETGTTCD